MALDYWCPPSNPDFRSWKPLHGNSFWISRSRSKTEVETVSANGKPIHIVLECVLFKSSQKSNRTDTPARVTNFCCWLNMCSAKKMCKTKNIQDFIKLQLDENIPKLDRIIKQQSVGSSSRNSAFGDGLQQGSMCSESWWWWSEWEGFVGFKSGKGKSFDS